MAESHPYTSSGPGGILQVVGQLRKQFPVAVSVETLKKLGLAKGSERGVLSVLKFVGVLEEDGKRSALAAKIFVQGDDDFKLGFAGMVEQAYADLFALRGADAWSLTASQLTSYFRSSDQTSELVGKRQAATFMALAFLSGRAEAVAARAVNSAAVRPNGDGKPKSRATTKAQVASAAAASKGVTEQDLPPPPPPRAKGIPSIHIDVQVHISPDTSPEQIDRIFSSMSKHLGGFLN